MTDPDFWLAVGLTGRVSFGSPDKARTEEYITMVAKHNDLTLALVPVWKNENPSS
jgi:hypothetical protein